MSAVVRTDDIGLGNWARIKCPTGQWASNDVQSCRRREQFRPSFLKQHLTLLDSIISNTFGFQPCQTHTYQAPFERRRRAKRAPLVVQRTHAGYLRAQAAAGSEPKAFSNAHIPKHPSSAGGQRKRAPRVLQLTHTDHPSSAGGERKRAPRPAQRTHTKHASFCESASTAMRSLHISWKPLLALYNGFSSPFEVLRQNRVPWEYLNISCLCMPARFVEIPIWHVPFERKAVSYKLLVFASAAATVSSP